MVAGENMAACWDMSDMTVNSLVIIDLVGWLIISYPMTFIRSMVPCGSTLSVDVRANQVGGLVLCTAGGSYLCWLCSICSYSLMKGVV